MNSLVEVLAGHAASRPDVLFAADDTGSEYSYAKAWDAIRTMASNLSKTFNVTAADKVMAKCNQQVNYMLLKYACELTGAIFVPIEGNASDDRIKDIYEETKSVLWVSDNHPLNYAKNCTYEDLLNAPEETMEFSFPSGDAVAEILYTTGTTGKSKGIVISHRANVALAENVMYGSEMKADSVEMIPLPMSHSHALRSSYANLLNGGTIVLVNGLMRINEVFALFGKYSLTALDLSPSAAQMLIRFSKGKFWEYAKDLDYIEIGTAALPETLKNQMTENLPNVRLYNFYGSTESGRSCVLEFNSCKDRPGCVGKPTRNSEIIFTDDERNPIVSCPENPGLLASKGPMNMEGYYGNEELSKEVLINGYVCTNDLGYFDPEGFIYITGRRDDVINCNGIKISPAEIEEVVEKFPGIVENACVAKKGPVAGQVPKLFLVAEDAASFEMEAFMRFLSEKLDKTKIPKTVELIEKLPRTYNGKVRRKDLETM